jgi:zinc-binding alcohol dehydrogenase/oxidoreductase
MNFKFVKCRTKKGYAFMKAVVFNPERVKPELVKNHEIPVAGHHEVVIRLYAAALNHRDLHITNPRNMQPFVYGSDGAGVIEEVGEGVTGWTKGQAVIINPQISCMQCKYCLMGEHSLCDTGRVLGGVAWNGTFAEFVKVPSRNVVKMPDHLTFVEAAALPLALGTAWRALISQAALKPSDTVLIQGIGGGVALFCLQIASYLGAKVIVTSGSTEKLQKAAELGAYAGINYKEENVVDRVMELTNGEGAHVVVASNGVAVQEGIMAASKKGRVVQYAYIGNPLPHFNVDVLMGKQVSLYGTAMHTYPEFEEAIRFYTETKQKPIISEVLPLEEAETAFAMLKNTSQFGKVVLSLDASYRG